jgi:ammonium transporter, Amt family
MTWLAYKAMAATVGVRASTLDEQRGLDYTEHYEVGYPELQQGALNAGKA